MRDHDTRWRWVHLHFNQKIALAALSIILGRICQNSQIEYICNIFLKMKTFSYLAGREQIQNLMPARNYAIMNGAREICMVVKISFFPGP